MVDLHAVGGLTVQVGWLGLRVGSVYNHIDQVNSRNGFSHDDSTINIIVIVIVIIIIIMRHGMWLKRIPSLWNGNCKC